MKSFTRPLAAVATMTLVTLGLAACDSKSDSAAESTPQVSVAASAPASTEASSAAPTGPGMDSMTADEVEAALKGLTINGSAVTVPLDHATLTEQTKADADKLFGADDQITIEPAECTQTAMNSNGRLVMKDLEFTVLGTVSQDGKPWGVIAVGRTTDTSGVDTLRDPKVLSGECSDISVSMADDHVAIHTDVQKVNVSGADTAILYHTSAEGHEETYKSLLAGGGRTVVMVAVTGDVSDDDLLQMANQVVGAVIK